MSLKSLKFNYKKMNWFGTVFQYESLLVDGYRGHEELIYINVIYDTYYNYDHAIMNPRQGLIYFYLNDQDVSPAFHIVLKKNKSNV
jgi:hypothetical protein